MKITNTIKQIMCGIVWSTISTATYCSIATAQTASFENPPIDYLHAPVTDPVAQLAAKIEAGEIKLKYDAQHGYLDAVLDELDIPHSSQTLVFSKTSMQLHRINPNRPRAVYFNDDVYVGYCQQGEVLELAATDPNQGAIFYSLKQHQEAPPKFIRDRGQCLTCHANSRTQNVPGYLIRSVYADRAGHPILGSGTFTTDQTSPFNERWGGWYVTGTHGEMRHMGNTVFAEGDKPDLEPGANLKNLSDKFSTKPYLTPHSDIVALMVMEHQTQMHNAITAANFETRQALQQTFQMNELLDREPELISESAQRRISVSADRIVAHLLMCDEFPLQSPVAGTSGFAEEFSARGPRDSQGRSLRDFELNQRLFKYPCSYLIYSPAFEALPEQVRRLTISRMLNVLEGRNAAPEFAHLTPDLRKSILEILRETKPEIFANSDPTASKVGTSTKQFDVEARFEFHYR